MGEVVVLTYLTSNNKQYIICGDINIDILSNNLESNKYSNLLAQNGFYSACNLYTRIQNTLKTCIDHLFIKNCF